jgi:hypothetical protein
VTTLLLLNGAPGVGKSTLARRWAANRPGTLVCDVDLLRTWVGGWRESFVETGARIRPAAAALMSAYLETGDVVLPQLTADPAAVAAYARTATQAGAGFVHVLLRDPAGDPAARFRRRTGRDPWHEEVRRIVDAEGGDALIEGYAARLDALIASDPGVLVVDSVEGDEELTCAALARAVAASERGSFGG